MSYPINTTIPNEPDDPVDDCPLMRGNFLNIKNFLEVDHVSPGAAGNGYHKEVTFFNKVAQGVPVDPTSVLYTESGTASTVADMRYRNANAVFPVSALRLCCIFEAKAVIPVGDPVPIINGFNVTSITKITSNLYQLTIPANIYQLTPRAMIIAQEMVGNSTGASASLSVAITATTLTLSPSSDRYVSIVVLQI